MKRIWRQRSGIIYLVLFMTMGIWNPSDLFAAGYCSGGAEPPFLSLGVDPNLLLIIDNSASMLDLAYEGSDNTCFDDSYDGNNTYTGYFDNTRWYDYNFQDHQFEKIHWFDGISRISNATFKRFLDLYIEIDVDAVSGELTDVQHFTASGNLLNWATASKLDIQKKILTGGKYDTADELLTLESRGCADRRYVKKISVTDSGGNQNFLTFGIRPPKEKVFDAWVPGDDYANGAIVNFYGDLFIANTTVPNSTADLFGNVGGPWDPYTATRWTNNVTYPPGAVVSDPSKANTIDKGQLYITAAGGNASGTGVDNDTGITDWLPYDTTHIEIFRVTENGFDNSDCQLAIEELGKESPNQGQLKQYIDSCMEYQLGGASSDAANSHAAFNHAIHNCWYNAKHGVWPPGAGAVNSQKNACETIYTAGIEPWYITPDDRGYGCYGSWSGDPATETGYVGRCWNPGAGAEEECPEGKYFSDGTCKKPVWVGGTAPGWHAAGYADVDTCIETAMRDYCGTFSIPEVIDPSDQVGTATADSETFWNIPAVLVDSGVVAQLDEPIAVMKGIIAHPLPAPEGLIQEYADKIRIGAMVFNAEGSDYECDQSDPFVLYDCDNPANRDGGKVVSEIDQSDAHTGSLVTAINDIKATSWTPLAEAFFNAIAYYAQDPTMKLNPGDPDPPSTDPIEEWCQNNNILIITEGASTADKNIEVNNFISNAGLNSTDDIDEDADNAGSELDCGALNGSSLLDDLTFFANKSENLYDPPQMGGMDKKKILTHIVVAGDLRSTGTGECSPDNLLTAAASNGGTTLIQATNPSELKAAIEAIFASIHAGAAAGSAASVISASRSGEGAAYQAIFWKEREDADKRKVAWTGEVHSLFVDSKGLLYEDSNGDRTLDANDERVVFFFDDVAEKTRACYGALNPNGSCSGTAKELAEVRYLWSAAEWLAGISDTNILLNRTSVATDPATDTNYISSTNKRFIFTWNDLDNDGITDSNEVIDFDDDTEWASLGVTGGRGEVPFDFGVRYQAAAKEDTDNEVDEIVNWIRGFDQAGLRSREILYDFDHDGNPSLETWRMSDIIHSTPVSVSAPAEGFHFLYRDSSYTTFVAKYKRRRHMIYFGGNDGMLHGINGGFFDEASNRFCRTEDCTDEGATSTSNPDLGAEMWAYIPYNILPHLQCLTEEGYLDSHKYFVDLRPRIFDARIFPVDDDHPNGWGTILVSGMGLGGGKVTPGDLNPDINYTADYPSDNREFTSAYFILDITNPEKKPVLLGEFTRTTDGGFVDLGYSTAIPTLVTMKEGTAMADHDWYLILGSGPTEVDGTSDQNGKLAVMPLDWLTGTTKRPFRIKDSLPSAVNNQGGIFTLDAQSFVSDIISVDFELEPDYKADAVYFGTVSGTWGTGFGGKMYRLVTRKLDVGGEQVPTEPSDWSALLSPAANPTPLIDAGRPITASAGVGTDGKNFWVYFGTGRFLHGDDRMDATQQTFFGIKEPMSFATVDGKCSGTFTWETVEKAGAYNSTPGAQGLFKVDQINVASAETAEEAVISCIGGGTACLPVEGGTPVATFAALTDYITGTGNGCGAGDKSGKDGWYRDFSLDRERNVGQATLLSGLLTYTTYQPYDEVCRSEGLGYLYGLFYQTGTAYFKPVFITDTDEGIDADGSVKKTVALGRGLTTTPNLHVGKGDGAKAFVQTSTGAIVEVPQPQLPLANAKSGRISWGVAE